LGLAPQIPQVPFSFCSKGLLLLQVPENFPSFFNSILMAIPAKASPMSTMERSTTVINKGKEEFLVYGFWFLVLKVQCGLKISGN
jgi:hypothetical protein